ncbi:MAG: anti-sigma factor family protein [Gemmatimonadaceae bacterium]
MIRIDRYTCEEMVRRLDDFVDRELSPREMQLAREHIETCTACAQELAFAEAALRTIKDKLRRIAVPQDLMAHVAVLLSEAQAAEEQDPAS